MVNREDIVSTINKFFIENNLEDLKTLLINLYEFKNINDSNSFSIILNNPSIILSLRDNIIITLINEFNLNYITKNNVIIKVY